VVAVEKRRCLGGVCKRGTESQEHGRCKQRETDQYMPRSPLRSEMVDSCLLLVERRGPNPLSRIPVWSHPETATRLSGDLWQA